MKYRFQLAYLQVGIILALIISSLMSYYKTTLGFTATEVGFISSLTLLVSIPFLVFWGMLTDYLNNSRYVMLIVLTLLSIGTGLHFFVHSSIFYYILPLALITLARSPLLPLIDDSAAAYAQKEKNANYGELRAFGSLGFSVGPYIIVGFLGGYIFQNSYPEFLLIGILVCALILALLFFTLPNVRSKHNDRLHIVSDGRKLFKNKAYLIVLFVLSLSGATMDSHFVIVSSLAEKYTNPEHVGYVVSLIVLISAGVEIPFMFFSRYIINRITIYNAILLGIFLIILRFTIFASIHTLTSVYIFSALHGCTQGVLIPCSVVALRELVDPKLSATSLTLYAATLTLLTAGLNIVAGILSDYFGIYSVYTMFVIMNGIAFFIFLKAGHLRTRLHHAL